MVARSFWWLGELEDDGGERLPHQQQKEFSLDIRRRTLIVLSGALAAVAIVGSAFAADTVTQTLSAGTRTASVANLTLTAATYSHTQQSSTGTLTLTADDSTGSGAGWNVTIQSSAFVYSGSYSGTDIPAANFALTDAAAPAATAGQAVDATNGPKVPATSPVGTLDSARKTVQANAAYGQGTYTQALGVSLTIPAQSRVGTYTGTLTTTISAAP
ncbi:MAG: WxL domain-containing protein [Chloroflexi bacterium]|nr:WxL domain-containing protein [Chloroflexota bacterium]